MMRRLVPAALVLFFVFAAVEFGLRDYWTRPLAPPDPANVFWTADYQREYTFANWQWNDALTYQIPADRTGHYVNFRGGFRVTVGQPDGDVPHVWILGSSMLLSLEVPDSETIPSYMQAALGTRYRVMNVGAPGVTTFHMLKRLEDLPVRAGDWVVFYDGLPDVDAAIYRPARDSIAVECALSTFATFKWLCGLLIPGRVTEASITEGIAAYRGRLAKAEQWTTAHGARFLHVLQPHQFTLPLNKWEERVLWTWPGMDVVFHRVWPIVEQGETGVNLTHVLDVCRVAGACWFFETFHVNSAANKVIARAIARQMRGKG